MFTQFGVDDLSAALAPKQSIGFGGLLRSPWLHPLNDATAWESMLSAVNPMWSTRGIPARVKGIIDETADTKTFVLRPKGNWTGYRAGQHVVVEVEINGRRLHRSFSLSSNPSSGRELQITVKRHPNAQVSNWMHANVKVGDVLRLSEPAGSFCVPDGDAEPLLLLSAGSGITPLMSILRELHLRGHAQPVVFLHCCRAPADFIFARELAALAASWPMLDLRVHYSAFAGRLDIAVISQQLPDFVRYQVLVCGPSAFTEAVEHMYRLAGVPERVRSESYSGRVLPRSDAAIASHPIHCLVTEQAFTARGDRGLLGEAEVAGLKPAHGCRIGICKTCQCLKRSGSVENLRTGVISSEPNELIQLCISVARSPLELAL